MDRQSLYFKGPEDPPTFAEDENLPALPLPELNDTLDRYYSSLLPFGSDEELKNTREILRRFREGTGPKLHQRIVDRAKVDKNWVSGEEWRVCCNLFYLWGWNRIIAEGMGTGNRGAVSGDYIISIVQRNRITGLKCIRRRFNQQQHNTIRVHDTSTLLCFIHCPVGSGIVVGNGFIYLTREDDKL